MLTAVFVIAAWTGLGRPGTLGARADAKRAEC